MANKENLIRVALVGCGTFAEQYHMPVLAGHRSIKLAALVDHNHDRRSSLAIAYQVDKQHNNITELSREDIDAVVIATPPAHHAPSTIELLNRGFHVFVEKPMAFNMSDAERMCAASEKNKRVLSVGVYKRLLPGIRLIKELISDETYGKVISCSVEWGGIGGFNSATLGLMKKESAGGGVLMDLGPHLVDILTFWFGESADVLSYHDDSRGGIEADCEATVQFKTTHCTAGLLPVNLRLSRVRELNGGLVIDCEDATLSIAMDERFEVTVKPHCDQEARVLRSKEVDTQVPWYAAYRAEIDDWIQAIQTRTQPQLSGRSCLAAVRLIDECYSKRQSLTLPWHANVHIDGQPNLDKPRVLITGAGGFLGSRTAQLITEAAKWHVRGQIRRPGSAARLARQPVEMVQGNLLDAANVEQMVADCDAVIHCAVGTDYGSKRNVHAVTVNGTRRLIKSAAKAGVRRFIHISSIGVHDERRTGKITSQTPLRLSKQDWYGYTKGLAEKAVLDAKRAGMETAILRPGCIYGPFGHTFVVNPLRALQRNALILDRCKNSNSNTVYIDNVVEAIQLALNADHSQLRTGIYPVGDPEDWTWGQYFGFFGNSLGKEIPSIDGSVGGQKAIPQKSQHRRLLVALKSTEAKSFAKRLLQTDPIGTLPRWILENIPATETWIRNRLGMNEPQIYLANKPEPLGGEIRFTARNCNISISEIQKDLGYQGTVSRNDAMESTLQWTRHAGVLPEQES